MATKPKKMKKQEQPPRSVQLIRAQFAELMSVEDPETPGQKIGLSLGVYAFFDFDGEPIYVGQTSAWFADRVSRHLTGQRSDPVAKFILDPFEVADVAMWSVPVVAAAKEAEATTAAMRKMLEPYEYSVYKELEAGSRFKAVLNEKPIPVCEPVDLPEPVRGRIIPDELWEDRQHADVRIARRAATISRLSQTISERQPSAGMRRTLRLQADRLAWLADARLKELGADVVSPDEEPATGDE